MKFVCIIFFLLNLDLPDDFIETKNGIKQVAAYENLKPHLKEMYKEQNSILIHYIHFIKIY